MFIDAPISSRFVEVDPQHLRREQINILYRALPLSLITILIFSMALAMLMFGVVSELRIAAWLIAVLVVILLRWNWHTIYSRRDEVDATNDDQWLKYNLIGVGISGVVWGSAGLLLFPPDDILHQLLMLFILAAITAGSISTLSVLPQAIHPFISLAILPLILRMLWEGGDSAQILAPVGLLFFLVVHIGAVRIYSNILLALTARLALEHAIQDLRESTEQNRLLLESVSEGIFGIDEDGITTFVNPAAAQMLGYSIEELLGKSMHDMIHYCHADGQEYAKEDCPLEHALTEGKESHLTDEVLWRKDGSSFPVEYRSRPMLSNGKVAGAVMTFSNISARKLAEAQLERQAFYDNLTGLPNRVLLQDRLEQAVVHARRHKQMGALLFLDLDQFKMINDTLGHVSGDLLLKEMAARLRGSIRSEDTAARMGGDEFVVLMTGLHGNSDKAVNNIRRVADKIHQQMSVPVNLGGHRLQVTCSIGIAMFPINHDNADAILMQADTAMYRAKESGRNGTQFFLPSMQLIAEERLAVQTLLQHAAHREQLRLHYQLQYNSEREVIGAEALLRWQHPEKGLILPQEFISVAEETGLILSLGEWVLESGCDMLRRHGDPEAEDYLPCLAINVSPSQFRQGNFVELVSNVVRKSGIDAARLELELTENILLNDIEGVASRMEELRQLGVRFSLDDFGTGYSSLSYLQNLPLDRLKIDQSFIRNIPEDVNSMAIVDTIIGMTDHLGLDVIAEGVENIAQLEALADMGCHNYQGYYFNRPMTEEALVLAMREKKASENGKIS